jgi:hypothetical protein
MKALYDLAVELPKAITSRELDVRIYQAMVNEYAEPFKQYRGMVWTSYDKSIIVPSYTIDLNAAAALLPNSYAWSLDRNADGTGCASASPSNYRDIGNLITARVCFNPPMALVLVAVKARIRRLEESKHDQGH